MPLPRTSPRRAPVPLATAIAAGLRWLYTTAQPPQALLHDSVTLTTTGTRSLRICPAGLLGQALIVVTVDHCHWHHDGTRFAPTDQIGPQELDQLTRMVSHFGGRVSRTWGGHPTTTGALVLHHRAHPTLTDAALRYRAGCPNHPDRGVSCTCGWYEHGTRLLIHPQIGGHPQ